MRVIDARSGKEMNVGDTVRYGDGEEITLVDVDEGFFSANAVIARHYYRFEPSNPDGRGRLMFDQVQIPLTVRFMHPGFLFQKVGFIPS